jgi:hypothetical protein
MADRVSRRGARALGRGRDDGDRRWHPYAAAVYLSPDSSPNALSAGRNEDQALVVVTRGLLERLDKEELEGVAAHEIAHIRNLDVRVMTYAAVLAGSVALIAELLLHFDFLDLDGPWWFAVVRGVVYLLAILLAPVAALVVQLAVSRRRELLADATGRRPYALPPGPRLGAAPDLRRRGGAATLAQDGHPHVHRSAGGRGRKDRGALLEPSAAG